MKKYYYVMVQYDPETEQFAVGSEMAHVFAPIIWDENWVATQEDGWDYPPTEEDNGNLLDIEAKLRYTL
jgi:hypothetical protein